MTLPTHDVATAARFLEWLGQANPVVYTLTPRTDGKRPAPIPRPWKSNKLPDILAEHVATYYSLASVKPKLANASKAGKEDLVSTRHLHVDLDPWAGNNPADELTRLFDSVTDKRPASVPAPSAIVMSGRGVQALWALDEEIALPDGTKAVEEANVWLLQQLMGPEGTHNVDRILRLPGSWNPMDKKKLAEGFKPCQTSLFEANGRKYKLADFGKPAPKQTKSKVGGSGTAEDIQDDPVYVDNLAEAFPKIPNRVRWLISQGAPGKKIEEYEDLFGKVKGRKPTDRSEWLFDVACNMIRGGIDNGRILGVMLDPKWGISGHCRDQEDPEHAARRQLARAHGAVAKDKPKDPPPPSGGDGGVPPLELDFILDQKTHLPLKIPHNVRVSLHRMGVVLRHDDFADLDTIQYGSSPPEVMQDHHTRQLWFDIEAQHGYQLGKDKFADLLMDEARKNSFHPVKSYLATLTWDGVARLDKWLITYGGAKDSPYTRAVGALPLVAAVRRIRNPGCAFQEILTLVSATQGTYKSTAIQTLCPNQTWYTDDLPLNAKSQEVIERLQGHWIVECAETKGMKQGGDDHIKAFLSRKVDKSRMAYGKITKQAPRQCVFIATSNDESFLRDPTGNRRWWPVTIIKFDTAALARDRDQLWAEAAHREAAGESIGLAPELYGAAGAEQEARTIEHPFVDILGRALDGMWGKILAADAWDLLGSNAPRTQDGASNLRLALEKLGWHKGKQRFKGAPQNCYVKDLMQEDGTAMAGKHGEWIGVIRPKDGRPMAAYLNPDDEKEQSSAF